MALCLRANINTTTITSPANQYTWLTSSYSACSKSCGKGLQTRVVQCQKSVPSVTYTNPTIVSIVSDSYCTASVGTKPVSWQFCNIQSCTTTDPTHGVVING